MRGMVGSELVRVCAWCDRVELDGRWVEPKTAIATDLATHGICPRCFRALLARGGRRSLHVSYP